MQTKRNIIQTPLKGLPGATQQISREIMCEQNHFWKKGFIKISAFAERLKSREHSARASRINNCANFNWQPEQLPV